MIRSGTAGVSMLGAAGATIRSANDSHLPSFLYLANP